MSTPVIRSVVASAATTAGTTLVVTLAASTAVGDLLLIFHGHDWDTAAGMTTPTFSQAVTGTTLQGTSDNGANTAHARMWTAVTTVAGAQTVTSHTADSGAESSLHVIVIDGSTVDTASYIDGTVTTGGSTTTATAQVAPAVVPVTSDALLVCMVQTDGLGGVPPSYTPPTGMAERSDVTDGTFTSGSTASVTLAASGSTGTKTFTATTSRPYVTISAAIKGGTGGGGAAPASDIPRRSTRRGPRTRFRAYQPPPRRSCRPRAARCRLRARRSRSPPRRAWPSAT
jgi:hypothetical protein